MIESPSKPGLVVVQWELVTNTLVPLLTRIAGKPRVQGPAALEICQPPSMAALGCCCCSVCDAFLGSGTSTTATASSGIPSERATPRSSGSTDRFEMPISTRLADSFTPRLTFLHPQTHDSRPGEHVGPERGTKAGEIRKGPPDLHRDVAGGWLMCSQVLGDQRDDALEILQIGEGDDYLALVQLVVPETAKSRNLSCDLDEWLILAEHVERCLALDQTAPGARVNNGFVVFAGTDQCGCQCESRYQKRSCVVWCAWSTYEGVTDGVNRVAVRDLQSIPKWAAASHQKRRLGGQAGCHKGTDLRAITSHR